MFKIRSAQSLEGFFADFDGGGGGVGGSVGFEGVSSDFVDFSFLVLDSGPECFDFGGHEDEDLE